MGFELYRKEGAMVIFFGGPTSYGVENGVLASRLEPIADLEAAIRGLKGKA